MDEFFQNHELLRRPFNFVNRLRQIFFGSQESLAEAENISVENVAVNVVKLFDQFPMAYKMLASKTDVVMVVAGIKATTDLTFAGGTWNEIDFSKMKAAFESVGLRVSEVRKRQLDTGEILFRQVYVYNPVALEKETRNSKLAPPYKRSMDIDRYLLEAEKDGYEIGATSGKIYSFPESAIQDFLGDNGDEEANEERVSNGGKFNETYWWYPPAKPDVIAREKLKKDFMKRYENIPAIIQLYESAGLKLSIQEWKRRFKLTF